MPKIPLYCTGYNGLTTSMQYYCCPHHNGVVAVVKLVLLPSSQWCRHHHQCTGVFVALIALAALPTLHRHCPPCCTGVVALIVLTSLPSCCMGIVTILAPALLPHLAGMFVPFCWCPGPYHTGVVSLCALALAPLMHRLLCPCCACILQSICRRLCPC